MKTYSVGDSVRLKINSHEPIYAAVVEASQAFIEIMVCGYIERIYRKDWRKYLDEGVPA